VATVATVDPQDRRDQVAQLDLPDRPATVVTVA